MPAPTVPSSSNPPSHPDASAGHWVLLWSQRQNALHVEPLEEMLSSNRRAYMQNRAADYVPVLVGSKDLMHSTAAAMRRTIRTREEQRWKTAA